MWYHSNVARILFDTFLDSVEDVPGNLIMTRRNTIDFE